jgi:hypothetical protein
MKVIKILGLADGSPTPFDGQYVVEFDPARDGHDPQGRRMNCLLRTSADRRDALELRMGDAVRMWLMVDPRCPMRPDGKPNRPLSAFTTEIS